MYGPGSKETQLKKMLAYKVKVTSYLVGAKKNAFLLDAIKRVWTEAELVRNIISLHYDILEKHKIERSLDFKEIRKILLK